MLSAILFWAIEKGRADIVEVMLTRNLSKEDRVVEPFEEGRKCPFRGRGLLPLLSQYTLPPMVSTRCKNNEPNSTYSIYALAYGGMLITVIVCMCTHLIMYARMGPVRYSKR